MSTDIERKIDKEILPVIREKLLCAYDKGYRQATIDAYCRRHNVSCVDFGLPSGTLWIVRQENLTYTDAKARGLEFPTEAQVDELYRCKWKLDEDDIFCCHVKGPNGQETGVFNSNGPKLCIWTKESTELYSYVDGYIFTNYGANPLLKKTTVFVGESYSTLFVLPTDLSK